MSVRITSACITCGACLWECPNQAILPGNPRPVVEPDRCTECLGWFADSQCFVVCPADAIEVLHEPQQVLLTRFTQLHPERQAHDIQVWRPAVVPKMTRADGTPDAPINKE